MVARISFPDDYVRQETEFCKKELEDFYNCDAPVESHEKKTFKRLLIAAKNRFARQWFTDRTDFNLFIEDMYAIR
jgi:hypothetical protein